jgi:hypothetical protein
VLEAQALRIEIGVFSRGSDEEFKLVLVIVAETPLQLLQLVHARWEVAVVSKVRLPLRLVDSTVTGGGW